MKVRCTVLCVVIASVALACRQSEAQQMVGPFQPGYQVAGSQRWTNAGYFPVQAAPGPYAQPAGPYLEPPGPGAGPYGQYGNYQQISDIQPAGYGGGAGGPMPGAASHCNAGDGGCGICGGCNRCRGRLWAEAEALAWWRKGRYVPALVTTSPQGTPQDLAGELGQPTTQILFGGERLNGGAEFGGRFELGLWADDCENLGIGVSFFTLGEDSVSYASGFSTGNPILARPFFNGGTAPPQQDALLIAFDQPPPPLPQGNDWVDGQVNVGAGNQIYGGEFFLRKKINFGLAGEYCMFFLEGPAWACSMLPSFRGFPSTDILDHAFSSHGQRRFSRVDFIAGYQFSQIDDSLSIRSLHVDRIPRNLVPNGTETRISDLYDANNQFHGGMLGLMAVAERGCWSLEMLGKVGIGNMHQSVAIGGQTIVTHPPPFEFLDSTRPGGLYTTGSVGTYSRDVFAVVPEARAKLRYHINCHLDLNISYSFIYWNSVALAGGQINQTFNSQQPVVIQGAEFSAQGLACGLRYRF